MNARDLPKLFFHLAVASILVFGPGLFVTWAFALVVVLNQLADPRYQRWKKRLLALVIFDTILIASFSGLVAQKLLKDPDALGGLPERQVIGVSLEVTGDDQLRVTGVTSGGPAEQAGVRQGDVLVSIDGERVSTVQEAQQQVARARGPTKVVLTRDGEALRLEVTPARSSGLGTSKRGLFEPEAPGQCVPFRSNPTVPWALLFSAAVVIVLYLLGRRRGMDATLLWCGGLFLVASLLTQGASIFTCLEVGGQSRGGILVALLVQVVVLIAGGALLLRRMRRGPVAELVPTRPPARVFFLGTLYLVGGGIRVGAALTVVLQVLGREQTPYADSIVHEIGRSGLGVTGAIAFLAIVAILGPIGEELVFRGVVLPWLCRWMKPMVAIFVSGAMFGALHLFYGPFVLIAVYYGLVLGWARLRSGGLLAPIALHIAINGTVSAIMLWMTRSG